MLWLLQFLVITCAVFIVRCEDPAEVFVVTYEWNKLDFMWPNDAFKVKYLASSQYIPENTTVSGVKVWRDRLYLSLPRWKNGVPATLASIPLSRSAAIHDASPKLEPFPSWEMQQVGNCSALQNVQSVEIHPDGFMWVVDSGRVNTLSHHSDDRCPPKLLIFDLSNMMISSSRNGPYDTESRYGTSRGHNTQNGYNQGEYNTNMPHNQGDYNHQRGYNQDSFDHHGSPNQGDYNFQSGSQLNYNSQNGPQNYNSDNIYSTPSYGSHYSDTGIKGLRSFIFPSSVVSIDSYLGDIVLDIEGDGYSYISDASETDPGIIVYSWKENRAWKIRDNRSMRADQGARNLRINGINVNINRNVAGLALSPTSFNRERLLYYSPLSSYSLFSIPTSILRDESQAVGDVSRYVKTHGRKESITEGMGMDSRGVLYYGLLGLNAIARWDTNMPYNENQHTISQDELRLQWPASFGFDSEVGNLTVVSNRFQNFLTDRVDLREPNFRIITAHTGSKSYLYAPRNTMYSTSTSTFYPTEYLDRSYTDERNTIDHTQHQHINKHNGVGRMMSAMTTVAVLVIVKMVLA